MSRWIEYDAIDYRNDKMHDKSSDFIDGVIYMAQRIEDAPSINIVFCKECKFESTRKCPPHRMGLIHEADDFCSYGICKTNTTAEEKLTSIRDYMIHGERREL